jgi:mono/diheme cytochrome c family protein
MLIAMTSGGKVALGLVAGAFIAFALIVSLVIPRSRPEFPGNRIGAFIAATAIFFVALMGTVWFTASGGEGHAAEPGHETTTEANEADPVESPTEGEETESESGAPAGDAAAGEEVFAANGCGACHTLAAAGATGNVGPNLDEAQPDAALVVDRVTHGKGGMPPFPDLSEQQVADVAAFVSENAGQ